MGPRHIAWTAASAGYVGVCGHVADDGGDRPDVAPWSLDPRIRSLRLVQIKRRLLLGLHDGRGMASHLRTPIHPVKMHKPCTPNSHASRACARGTKRQHGMTESSGSAGRGLLLACLGTRRRGDCRG